MRCQRCGFEIPEGLIDCPRCEKRQVVKNTSLPTSLSYFLCVVINTLGLILALLVFKKISDPFEVIVISGLVIIYLAVKGAAGMNTLGFAEFAKLIYGKFRKEGGEQDTDEGDDSAYVETQHTRAKVKMYINSTFDALLYIVAIFNLIVALYQ